MISTTPILPRLPNVPVSQSTPRSEHFAAEDPFSKLTRPTSPSQGTRGYPERENTQKDWSAEPPSSLLQRVVAHLSLKATLGHLASFTTSGALAYVGMSMLLQSGSTPMIAMFFALNTFDTFARIKRRRSMIQSLIDEPPPFFSEQKLERVRNIVRPLCAEHKIPEPHIHLSSQPGRNAGMIDRLRGRDVLIVSNELLECLNDRELRAVVAHELAHQNRWHNVVANCAKTASSLALPCLSWGTMAKTFGALAAASSAFIATPVALCAGFGVTCAAIIPLSLCRLYISRQNELATDLRACHMTGDPEALIDALGKSASIRLQYRPAERFIARLGLLSHPTFEKRTDNILRAFGKPHSRNPNP